MKKINVLIIALLIAVGTVTMARATTIGFDGYAPGTNINGVNLGGVTITAPDQIARIYQGYDVLYTSPWNGSFGMDTGIILGFDF